MQREQVKRLMLSYQVSERRACRVLVFDRSVCRYHSKAESQAFLIKRIKEIASIRVRYGYRRIHILLKREGWKINHKRVYNLYKQQDLQMRLKPPRRRVSFRPRQEPVKARRKNECWSMDFVVDQLFSGQRIRILTIVDNFTRENINLNSRFQYKGVDVANALSEAIKVHGVPETIKVDNGPEFISKEVDLWAYAHNVRLDFSRPGKPTDNAFIESFNGRFRQECLNQHWFLSLEDAELKIKAWGEDYNRHRPHSSLKGQTPEEFALSEQRTKTG